MKITFLEAEVPLTKTFNLENGEITKVGHPKLIDCTSHHYDVRDLDEFAVRIHWHAERGHCLLKGNTSRELKAESRAGSTDANAPTQWLCLDLDGLKQIRTVDEFMAQVGWPDISYIAQYSASMGVLPDRGLSAHVFVLLDREHLPDALKQWLKMKNFQVPGLRQGLSLTRTGNTLRWTLDVTTCQNDKLIYVAPPLLGAGVQDKFDGKRIQVVRKAKERATLSEAVSPEVNRIQEQVVIDALRNEKGLEKKPWDRAKSKHGVTYMPKPDVSVLTGMKEERGFVYMNLNGGDSWGYYHPKENPEFVLNFKGEPVYRTEELLPDYWAGLQKARRAERRSDDRMYLVFRDWEGSTFYNAVYDPEADDLRIAAAGGEKQVRDWLTEHGQPQPEVIETWDLAYEPSNQRRVDRESKWLNTYRPSELERRYKQAPEPAAAMPPVVERIVLHALGGDRVCYEHFVNWLACVVQLKDRTQTAWVVHGIPGTGKGLLFNAIIRPLLGDSAIETRMGAFEGQFNGFLDGKLLVFVDEGEMDAHKTADVLEGDFKNYITEPRILVRHMRQTARSVRSHLNFLVASNKGAIRLTDNDRRYNVAPYQQDRLELADGEYEQLEAAAWQLYNFLMAYPADPKRARTALANEAKSALAAMNRNSIEETCKALLDGSYDFFAGYVGADAKALTTKEQELGIEYRKLVEAMDKYKALSRDEVYLLMSWIVGGISPAPAKFTKLLAHHRVRVEPQRREDKQFRGIAVNWRKDGPA